jgi:membrane protease YdiL (CAAX protease family)
MIFTQLQKLINKRKDIIGLLLIIIYMLNVHGSQIIMLLTHKAFGYVIWIDYCIATLLIINARNEKESFGIDRVFLFFYIFSTLARRRLGYSGETYALITIGILGLFILIDFIRGWKAIPKGKINWILLSITLSIVLGQLIIWLYQLINNHPLSIMSFSTKEKFLAIRYSIFYLSFSVPTEELIFRGFLWGYLLRLGIKERYAFIIQFVLFWFAHIYSLFLSGSDITGFFIYIPIAVLFLSLLRYYSKSITPPLIAHLIIDTLIAIFI